MTDESFSVENVGSSLHRAEETVHELVSLTGYVLDMELLSEIPVELMVRYGFIPLERSPDGSLVVAVSDNYFAIIGSNS